MCFCWVFCGSVSTTLLRAQIQQVSAKELSSIRGTNKSYFQETPSLSDRYIAIHLRHIVLERSSLIFSLLQKLRCQRTSSNNLNESHRRGIEASVLMRIIKLVPFPVSVPLVTSSAQGREQVFKVLQRISFQEHEML